MWPGEFDEPAAVPLRRAAVPVPIANTRVLVPPRPASRKRPCPLPSADVSVSPSADVAQPVIPRPRRTLAVVNRRTEPDSYPALLEKQQAQELDEVFEPLSLLKKGMVPNSLSFYSLQLPVLTPFPPCT
jgi:hypothetical protein